MSAEALNKARDRKRCKRAKEKPPLWKKFPFKLSLSLAYEYSLFATAAGAHYVLLIEITE
jgi:hypothetical protein